MDQVLELNVESAHVVDEVYKSLVQVRNGKRGAGAGTIWHPQGLIVTNAHVAGRGPLKVELADGRVVRRGDPVQSTGTATWRRCASRPTACRRLSWPTHVRFAPASGSWPWATRGASQARRPAA